MSGIIGISPTTQSSLVLSSTTLPLLPISPYSTQSTQQLLATKVLQTLGITATFPGDTDLCIMVDSRSGREICRGHGIGSNLYEMPIMILHPETHYINLQEDTNWNQRQTVMFWWAMDLTQEHIGCYIQTGEQFW